MRSRSDAAAGLAENFTYDGLNRLSCIYKALSAPCSTGTPTISYGASGNILSKAGVGTYNYDQNNNPHPHQLTSITSGGIQGSQFQYGYFCPTWGLGKNSQEAAKQARAASDKLSGGSAASSYKERGL